MNKNMNKRATKRKSATENSILKFLAVSSVSSDSIVKGIIDDIIKTAVKTVFPLLTCTLLKLCLSQVLFNKRRMQVKCISQFNLTQLCNVY
jgi:hypothetical protein